MNDQTEYEIDAAIAQYGFGDEPKPRPMTARQREVAAAIERNHGNYSAAARELGISHATVSVMAMRLKERGWNPK